MAEKSSKIQRRSPKQARSRATCDAILEAASQILERDGAGGFNTNSVAERAGVSIGTLYQYYPDKTAILAAAAEREATNAEPRLAGRHKALLRALAAFLESFRRDAAMVRTERFARVAKPGRRNRFVVIRLRWTAPALWQRPSLIPVLAKSRAPRR